MTWTRFMDMHSGGGQKLAWAKILIEAPEAEAKVIFYNRFGRNPERVTCTCCGDDYSIREEPSLEQATAFDRGCTYAYRNAAGEVVPDDEAWVCGKGIPPGYTGGYEEYASERYGYTRPYFTLDQYLAGAVETVTVIRTDEIKPEERTGNVPAEGYVWAGDDD